MCVFLASLAIISAGAGSPGLATAWVDPVAKIQAQDEAVYAAVSLGMARGDGWLTPKFLGRLALFKPPLLYWASAASVKVFGPGALALRVPALLAGAGTVTVVFLWVAESGAVLMGLVGALLTLSSHMVFVLSRVAITDAPLTFEVLVAVWILARDPRLERTLSVWVFGITSGAAMMTKGVAGAMPLLVLGGLCFWKERPQPERIALRRIFETVGIAALVAAPWHLYQLVVHPHWFWAEYVLSEHLTWGLTPPGQTTEEWSAWFYARRLFWLDPVLVVVGVVGVVRSRSRVVVGLLIVNSAAVLLFQYRNAAYLMPMFPGLAIAGATCWAGVDARRRPGGLPHLAVLALIAKVVFSGQAWGLPFAAEFVNPSYAGLEAYAGEGRGNELAIGEPDDQFYSATLRLARVRYLYVDPREERTKLPLDFEDLGVTVTVGQFARLAELTPMFAARLRAFDLDSVEPVATVILARSEAEVSELLRAHREIDFYAPARWAALDGGVHEARDGAPGRVWLRSRVVIQRP